jgi:hypothetical protein
VTESDRLAFHSLRHQLARIAQREDVALPVIVAAFAFELSVLLSVMPDEFWVTGVADPQAVTDAEAAREDRWNAHLDALCSPYLSDKAAS